MSADERSADPDDRPLAAAGQTYLRVRHPYWHMLLGDQLQVAGWLAPSSTHTQTPW
jgi:hypothetical protein